MGAAGTVAGHDMTWHYFTLHKRERESTRERERVTCGLALSHGAMHITIGSDGSRSFFVTPCQCEGDAPTSGGVAASSDTRLRRWQRCLW